MKNNILSFIPAFILTAILAIAGCTSKNEEKKAGKEISFKVYGNCEMCKKNIEGSLKGQDGINSASWDVEKKIMTVSFQPGEINENDIHKKIASVGYDTEKEKGDDNAYNNLAECCQYTRK